MEPVRIGVGGPVGAGKTMLVEKLTRAMHKEHSMAVVTNDIYTKEDALFLMKNGILPEDRIIGVETGGCPHTAIREDASMNFAAIDELKERHADLEIIFVESGGDNLAATFSPELVDFSIYIIDVAQGEKIPRKGGQGMIKSDLFIINKIDQLVEFCLRIIFSQEAILYRSIHHTSENGSKSKSCSYNNG